MTGIHHLKVVARDGIEPSTRGFSVRRRGRFGASKPKTRDAFSRRRPNRTARPSLSRTGTRNFGRARSVAHAGQRLARIATEPFPNRRPNGAALGFGVTLPSLAALRFAPSERTLYGRDRSFGDRRVRPLSGERSMTNREIERCVLRAGGEFGALACHVAFDLGEDGFEFGLVTDRVEGRVEIASIVPRVAPAGVLSFA